jgi:CxxC motif-containing protein
MRYAVREVKDPRRTFTSSVRVWGGREPLCPVRTARPIRRDDWSKARKLVGETSVRAPVRCGERLVRDFLEPGIDLVATGTVEPAGGRPV